MSLRRRTAWGVYVVLGTVVAGAYFVVTPTPVTKLVLYNGLGLSAILAVLTGVRRHRPATPRPWYLFMAGQLSFLTADVIFYGYQDILQVESPFPSIADAFYLGMYPLVIAGLVLLIRQLVPGRDQASLLDAAIIATGMFVLTWVFVMDSYAVDPGLSLLERVISLAYPMGDVLLLAVAARLAVAVRTRAPAFFLLSASIAGLLVADTMYGITQLAGIYETGSTIDIGWMTFYVLFGAAALHPSMASLSRPSAGGSAKPTLRRLLVLSLATLTVPMVDLFFGNNQLVDEIVTTLGAMTLFVLVLARVMGLVRAIEMGQERLRHEVLHDSLTGLANRVLFSDRVEHALSQRSTNNELVAVLFIDLDDFKNVNDSLGHQAGDELLVAVAERLRRCLRAGDTPARLGGDEFAVLLGDAPNPQDAPHLADRILEALKPPVPLCGREVFVAASIGIAVQSRSQTSAEQLLRGADVAMYLAKSKGKGRSELFVQSMYDEVLDRVELRNDLQGALERNEFELYYQPIIALSGKISSIEALLRWHHPTRGVILPNAFIPLAEETGLIVPIGRWVLHQACAQAKGWQERHATYSQLGVSVNLSVRQLHDDNLVDDVAEALRASGLDPSCLSLELTESMLMADVELGAQRLARLKQLSVKVAIDDFGTGYSSLSYLQRFPVDAIKIDRSFVQHVARDANSSALVRSVVDLAAAMSVVTVAEGIEDAAQLSALQDLDCQLGQGFYFSRPLAAPSIDVLLGKPVEAAVRRSPPAPPAAAAEALRGHDALDRLGPQLDDLLHAVGIPVMARRPWLQTWTETHREYEPWAVAVRPATATALDAVALLAARATGDVLDLVALGHGRSWCTRMPVRNHGAAGVLADALAELLASLDRPWTLHLEQLPAGDPVAVRLAERLPHGHLLPELRVPRVRLNGNQSVGDHLSRNTRKALRRARNRIDSAGMTMRISFEQDPRGIAELLVEVELVHRSRDHDQQRSSDLDSPAGQRFWRDVILDHAERGEVELATLRLDGRLAAYVVALLDGSSYRVFDGRCDSRFAPFSPGRLVEAATLERALTDQRFEELDWMSGISPEKLLAENASQARVRFIASSADRNEGDCPGCRADAVLLSMGG